MMSTRISSGAFLCLCLTLLFAWSSPAMAATCEGFICTIEGTSSGETLNGTSGADIICGLGGNDTINGQGSSDILCGGAGADTIDGGNGDDLILGESGSDTLTGGDGSDTARFLSSVSADLSTGSATEGSDTDTLSGFENLRGSDSADTLTGDSGNNTLDGQGGDDILNGEAGTDTLIGRHGNDTLEGGSGGDSLDGGGENDTASYTTAAGITASLTTGTASDGDTLTAIENLTGSPGSDSLEGDANNNILIGGISSDFLDGQGGTDTCNGGPPLTDTCQNCETETFCEF